jgi:Na+/H+ antiporter NhaC
MLIALLILWLAWTLSSLTQEESLGTGSYLGGMIGDRVSPVWLPTVTFVLASVVAFATGTSWGTMGILMPLVIRVTVQILGAGDSSVQANDPILVASIGSVLAGAIFGDHCSPISDTTVLSSLSAGCDHVQHVRTQLPYALAVGLVAIGCGTLPVGCGASPWLLLPLGILILAVGLMLIGRRTE